jgi:hypothetical protein
MMFQARAVEPELEPEGGAEHSWRPEAVAPAEPQGELWD